MSSPFKSMRWRLQAWHGLMLLLVLSAFGATAYYLVFDNRMRRVDQELERRALPIAGMMNRFGAPPGGMKGPFPERKNDGGRPGDDKGDPDHHFPGPPPEFKSEFKGFNPDFKDEKRHGDWPRPEPGKGEGTGKDGRGGPEGFRSFFNNMFPVPPDMTRSFEETGTNGYYFVIWSDEKKELKRSTNAPANVPMPVMAALGDGDSWTRDGIREYAQATRRGNVMVLVGHDITGDLAELNRVALLLAAAGAAVLVLGLAGGWWLATRAIAPIADISAAAVKIADGNLAERVNVTEQDSELGQLAQVLNTTFERLQKAFDHQVRFTADASHELRTPISVILSQTQTALKREREAVEYRETIESCQRAAQRMRQLVESLLALARIDSGESGRLREPVELHRVAGEVAEMLRPLATENNVRLETQLPPIKCAGDASQLTQVVTNLVGNAIHYNRAGGEVRVAIAEEPDAVVLTVSDTGRGIPAEDVPHIFERFYRADKARSNPQGRTGLGLAITKAIVELHRGTISVTSEVEKGSTFTVRLPKLKPAAAQA